MLTEHVRIDLGHVSTAMHQMRRKRLLTCLQGTRWTSSRPGCEQQHRTRNEPSLTPYRQLQSGKATGEDAYNGMLDCFRKIVKNEG